ncbi:MAG: glycosyltransferase family 4 protein [Elusimicrobiota bacterium]
MDIILIPDPAAPNGHDAFCREVATLAAGRGHRTIDASPSAESVFSSEFGRTAGAVLANGIHHDFFAAAKKLDKKFAVRLIDSCSGMNPHLLKSVQNMALGADRLLLPSLHMAKIAASWGCNGNIRHVPYAYDRIMAGRIALLTARAVRRAAFSLVACVQLREDFQPGIETLFSAVAGLRLDFHLSIIGEGPLLESLRSKAGSMLISDRVSFLGALGAAQIGEHLRAAKAYIDPCGVDGFPNYTLHALAEGCPVIAARAGALPEIIRPGENGLGFSAGNSAELAEAIITLYSVRGLSLNLIADGVKTVEKHDWHSTAAAALSAIEELS